MKFIKTLIISVQYSKELKALGTSYLSLTLRQVKACSILTSNNCRLSLYALSSVALLPAIIIFHRYRWIINAVYVWNATTLICLKFRTLQVTRISIHKHLFVSLFLFTVTTGLFRVQVLLPHLELRSDKSFIYEVTMTGHWATLLALELSETFI